MTFRTGKHVNIDVNHPQGLGICDYTGFVFHRKDLIRQMEWRGNALVWTGYLVGRPYVDKPNAQLKPPMLKPDPVPLRDPRPPQTLLIIWSNIQSPAWGQLEIVSWASWGDYQTIEIVDLVGTNTDFDFGPFYEDGVPALPRAERYQSLQNISWGSS